MDFDAKVDRRHTNSMKWDIADGELPMWVADMDFHAAPAIRAAVEKRAAHGVYGYSILPEEWYDAYVGWWDRRHGLKLEKDWLVFCTGVIPAVSSAVRKLTTPAEKVVVMTPVYNIFFNSIFNNGRYILESPLSYQDGQYHIDFADLEAKLSDPQASLLILCNPHNPVGKCWSQQELAEIGRLCQQHGVVVLSDEIHCDLTDPGVEYTPFAAASDICRDISVTCVAPTKAFNIAGLHTAAVFAANPLLRHRIWRALNTDEVAENNAFAVDAAIAAFTQSEDWLDALRKYIYENKKLVADFLARQLPQLYLVPSQATYLLWIDHSRVTPDSDRLQEFIRQETGLFLTAGSQYRGNGTHFLRMNIACPRASVEDGLNRLKQAITSYRE